MNEANSKTTSVEARRDRWVQGGLFALLLLCYVYFLPRWADPNQNSRLDMVVAVVDDGTFQIDRYVNNTVDYARVGEHYYSDKAPGAAFVGIPVYAALRRVMDLPVMASLMARVQDSQALKATLRADGSGLLEEKVRFAMAQVALAFATAALPTALMGVLMYRLLGRFEPERWKRLLVVLGYGLLTPAFAYAGAFYGHQLSTACLFAAFYLLFMSPDPLPAGRLGLAGFLLGYAVFTEYPTALGVGLLGLYALYRVGWRSAARLAWLALPGLAVAAALLVYNRAVFGAWLDFGYSHSELWVQEHSQGFMSLTVPHPLALWGITFSPFRGLFFLSPLLLLALPGFVYWFKTRAYRAELWLAAGMSAAMLLFNASSGMWWGGFAVGPRYLLAMLPFLSLALVFTFRAWHGKRWAALLTGLLYAWSLIATWGLTLAEQAFPPDTIRNPLFEYALPNWLAGNIARNLGMFIDLRGPLSLIPLALGAGGLVLLLWRLATRASGGALQKVNS